MALLGDSGLKLPENKRKSQLERWEASDTNKQPSTLRNGQIRVKFPEDCVFLTACSQGDFDEVRKLLDGGAEINTGNVDGLTALHQVNMYYLYKNMTKRSFLQ